MKWTLYSCVVCRRLRYTIEWWALQPDGGCLHGKPWWPADNMPEKLALELYGPIDRITTGRLPEWVKAVLREAAA